MKFVVNRFASLFAFLMISLAAVPLNIYGEEASSGKKTLPAGPGIEYAWDNTEDEVTTLNLKLVDNRFILYFLNEQGEIVRPLPGVDKMRIFYKPKNKKKGVVTLTWDKNRYGFTHTRPIKRARFYWITLRLLMKEGDNITFGRQELKTFTGGGGVE